MIDRHTVAQHTRDQLGVVPIFWVELLRQTLNSSLVAAFVLKLEVVALRAVFVHLLDNLTLRDGLGQHDTLVVILQTREDLVGIAVQQSDEGHPFVLVVLESYHVAFQLLRTDFRHLGMLAGGLRLSLDIIVLGGVLGLLFFLVRLLHTDHHTSAASVAIDGTALAS